MKTKEQVLERVKLSGDLEGAFIDKRDTKRLTLFFPVSDWETLGFAQVDPTEPHGPEPWTEENIKEHLKHDLAFAFEKALNKRAISASLMREVILMWLWILDDGLQDDEHLLINYAEYGLPLLKAVALKHGLPNPIGDDTGSEPKYASESEQRWYDGN